MFDQEIIKTKKHNYNRLSLSQRKKKFPNTSPNPKIVESCPKTENSCNHDMSPKNDNENEVKNVSQLFQKHNSTNNDQTINGNAIDSKIELDCNIVTNANLDNKTIITLSSDDEIFQKQSKLEKKKRKPRKILKLDTPEKKDIKPKRKLTNSTNLKTFSAKNQPDNQTKLEKYFTLTQNPTSIKYFDTFEKSNNPEINESDKVLDSIELIMDDIANSAAYSKSFEKFSQNNIPDSVSNHYQLKKNITNKCNKVDNYLENNYPEKNQNKLLNKVIATESKNSIGTQTMTTTNIHNSDCQSRLDSSESIVFHYNSIPSVKTESVIYSLAEDAKVRRSRRLNSQSTLPTINSENLTDISDMKVLHKKKVRKRLSFQAETLTIKSDLIQSSSSEQLSKYTNSTISNNTSNSVYENESELEMPIKLSKLSKSTSKLKKKTTTIAQKRKLDGKITPQADGKRLNVRRKRVLQCPSYKIIEGTTFAVDGFRFGEIDGVTHYFLTHFHGDHYIGLKKTFSMPIYMSEITAKLVKKFINVCPDFLHIINPNETIKINEIEVAVIDANHCPGAVMFAFKLPNDKCILHTGDFRASPEMESEPYFWNNYIDTIYLDTTYLHKNYDFKSQSESITDLRYCIDDFREKHIGQKILFVCGSYVIGKEKVWSEIAKITGYRVYTDGNRRKALTAIADPDLLQYLIDNPNEANIHVVTMNEVNYLKLYDYYQLYRDKFDVVLGIRPSGWERNTKPQFSGIINVVGIEYSEHSSYSELRRFCRFLQPSSIISTVPINNNDIALTAEMPTNWFNNNLKPRQQAYQPTIRSYISAVKRATNINEPTCSKYLKQTDYCSDIGMLDATKSSIEISSPAKSKLENMFVITDVRCIDKLSEPLDDWMS